MSVNAPHARTEAGVRMATGVPSASWDWPVVTTANVICRDDLLFEIEVDAGRLTTVKS